MLKKTSSEEWGAIIKNIRTWGDNLEDTPDVTDMSDNQKINDQEQEKENVIFDISSDKEEESDDNVSIGSHGSNHKSDCWLTSSDDDEENKPAIDLLISLMTEGH